jgi:hypothetical protein
MVQTIGAVPPVPPPAPPGVVVAVVAPPVPPVVEEEEVLPPFEEGCPEPPQAAPQVSIVRPARADATHFQGEGGREGA